MSLHPQEQAFAWKKKYRLMWIPSLRTSASYGTYVVGQTPFIKEKKLASAKISDLDKKDTGNYITNEGVTVYGNGNSANLIGAKKSLTPIWDTATILDRSFYDSIVIPFNSNLALAQDYTTIFKSKSITYTHLSGNTVVNFGGEPKKISQRLAVIKQGNWWQGYTDALDAFAHMSAHKSKYLGSFYLLGFDKAPTSVKFEGNEYNDNLYQTKRDLFFDGNLTLSTRYRISIDSLMMQHRVDKPHIIDASLEMTVLYDENFLRLRNGQAQYGLL